MKRTKVILLAIILLASALRLYQLGQIPEGFHADEAAFGYNAFSILKTGKDEYGKWIPVIIKSFGDYKGALYSYLSIPFIFIFGLTEFAVRLPSAISGVLLVFLTFVFVRDLTKRDELALLASGASALMPITILVSRESEPALLATDFVILGLIAFMRWENDKKLIWFFTAVFSFAISMVTYFIPRLFVLTVIPILWLYERSVWKGRKLLYLIVLYLVMILSVALLTFSSTGARLGQVNVFTSDRVTLPLLEKLREDGVQSVGTITARVFHNKVSEYGRYLMHNYMQYFSFDYLFFEAGQPRREVVPGMGILYLVDLPFLLLGIYFVFHKKYRWGYFVISWLLITPLLLSFASDETPNIHRYVINALPVALLIALGIIESVRWTRNAGTQKFVVIGIGLLYIINFSYFAEQLFIHQPVHFPFYRGFAYKRLVEIIPKYYNSFDKVIVTKGNESPYIYFLFYSANDPLKYQASGSHRDLDYQGFGKYLFVPYDCPSFNESRADSAISDNFRTLLVRRGGCVLGKNDKLLESVPWHGGSEAFQLVEYQATPSAKPNPGMSL